MIVAEAQAQAGDVTGATETANSLEYRNDREWTLSFIAEVQAREVEAQAQAGDVAYTMGSKPTTGALRHQPGLRPF
jgi:hypothetical protein